MNYEELLKRKEYHQVNVGFEATNLNKYLFDFQKDIVKWALKKGRCALFEDTGLGKTLQQLSWAYEVHKYTNKPVIILAPLAVSKQTVKEGSKFGIDVKLCEEMKDVVNGINITNYEKIHKFDTDEFVGVVLDESSILKSHTGSTTNALMEAFYNTSYKLACTATPSPNDYTEIGTTAEFLGIMKRKEMLSTFFINDITNGAGWRLKGHSESEFYKWIGTWAMMIKKPSDLGYEDNKYNLPKLNIIEHILPSENKGNSLFLEFAQTLSERREARKNSLEDRVKKTVEIIGNSSDQFLVWCDFNNESELLHKNIANSVEVKGSDKPQHKESALIGFADNEVQILVSKPSIAGYGMNWQSCHNMIFCGLSDSYEMFYQAIRRCYRFGQNKEVNVHVIISEAEMNVLENIQDKERKHQTMSKNMIVIMSDIMKSELKQISIQKTDYNPQVEMTLL